MQPSIRAWTYAVGVCAITEGGVPVDRSAALTPGHRGLKVFGSHGLWSILRTLKDFIYLLTYLLTYLLNCRVLIPVSTGTRSIKIHQEAWMGFVVNKVSCFCSSQSVVSL